MVERAHEMEVSVLHAPLRTLTAREVWQQARTLPNILTYLRFLMVPAFVWFFHAGLYMRAFYFFAGAALTDGLDGFLARALHQQTRLGGLLDPVADKVLVLAAVASLVVTDRLPIWFLVLIILRDVLLATAVFLLRASGRPVDPAPTRLGKYATFLMAIGITLALLREGVHARYPSFRAGITPVLFLLSAECVVVSTVQYFMRWRRLMQVPPPRVLPVKL